MYEIPLEFCIDGISRVRFPPGMAELYEALKILGRPRSGKFRMWQSLALRGGVIGPYGASYRQGIRHPHCPPQFWFILFSAIWEYIELRYQEFRSIFHSQQTPVFSRDFLIPVPA